MCFLTPKFGYLGQKVIFLYGNRDFCQQGISQVYPGLQLSHSDHSPIKFHFQATGHFSGLSSPLFLALSGHSRVRGISTLNFGLFSTKLGGTVRAIKKMTQNDNGPRLGRNYRETDVLRAGWIKHKFTKPGDSAPSLMQMTIREGGSTAL